MNVFKIELKRAILNKWMVISILIGFVICCLPIYEKFNNMQLFLSSKYVPGAEHIVTTATVYQQFILFDRFEPCLYIFLFIMPILVSLPYGASFYNDTRSGYIKQIITRSNTRKYLFSKYLSTFISGGVVATIPVVTNFMILALIYPLNKPIRFYTNYRGEETFTIDLFFEYPLLHTIFWCFVLFVVAGLLATISLAISRVVDNYFGIILTPFAFSFILIFITYITQKSEYSFLYTISTSCVRMNYWILLYEIIGMFFAGFVSFVVIKKEVI